MNEIQLGEHVFIPGKTGSGKSYLAERYLANMGHVVMLDTKGETLDRRKKKKPLWHGVKKEDVTLVEHLAQLPDVETEKIIYAPAHEEMNEEHYNEFFRWIYHRQNCIAWVDEAMSVSKSSFHIPEYYKAILTRGRSRNTSVWSLTQRPVGINPLIMSQSTHFFVFKLIPDQDREKLVAVTGVPDFFERPKGFDFWYWRDGQDEATLARLVERR